MLHALRAASFAATVGLALANGAAAETAPVIVWAGGEPPGAAAALAVEGDLLAVSASLDGRRIAAAFREPGTESHSRVLLAAEAAAPIEVPVAGVVRALLFPADGGELLAIVHRPARRRGPGETHLAAVDGARAKVRELRTLPVSARSLDHWIGRRSILIAGDDEIRSLLVDGLRSGPLFRVPGANGAVASLAGSDLVLVGQAAEILLVDLGDPPGSDSMPVRERSAVPAPVVGLALAPDGASGFARLADGRLLALGFGPLRTEEAGVARGVAAAGRAESREPVAVAALQPPPPPTLAAVPIPSPTPLPTAPPPPPSAPPPTPPPAPAPTPTRVEGEVFLPPAAPPVSIGAPALSGRITGPAAASVASLVALGPSSVLREAARVSPGPDGSWRIDRLEPGRYRLQVDGGTAGVVACDPPFVVVDIVAGTPAIAPEIRALAVVKP